MKKTCLIVALICVASLARAQDRYWFKVATTNNSYKGAMSTTGGQAATLNPAEGRIWIECTQAQYGTGSQADFDALDPAVIAAGINAAKTQAADFEVWDEKLTALAKLMRDEINKIRKAHSQSEYSVAEWKQMLKDEM